MKQKIRLKDIYIFLCITFVCFGIHSSPHILSYLTTEQTPLTLKSNDTYEIDVSKLTPGAYFLSIGKTFDPCDVYLNSNIIFRGTVEGTNLKPEISTGVTLNIDNSTKSVQIKFKNLKGGFSSRFYQTPVIAPLRWGIAIHQLRNLIDLQIGPISALFLMFTGIMLAAVSNAASSFVRYRTYLAFSVTSLIYALSLSHWTRTFIPSDIATIIHISLRISLSLAAYFALTNHAKRKNPLIQIHLFVFVALFISLNLGVSPKVFYNSIYLLFPITSLYAWHRLRLDQSSRTNQYYAMFALSWGFAQTIDLIKMWTDYGVFITPIYLSLFNFVLIWMAKEENELSQKQDTFIETFTDIQARNYNIEKTLELLSMEFSRLTHFDQITTYVDAFLVGKSPRAEDSYVKIFDLASVDSNKKDYSVIHFSQNEGSKMQQAIKSGEIIAEKSSKDGNWFICIPISKQVCINLTHSSHVEEFRFHESLTALKAIHGHLKTLTPKLLDLGIKQTASLAKLRQSLGDGAFDREIGAIFVDIADYSKFAEIHGNDYARFISVHYLPALIKNVSNLALPEVVRGDEVYFVICQETVHEPLSVAQATANALAIIQRFTVSHGKNLCTDHGYSPVEVRIGCSLGEGTITLDEVQARTSGDHINQAKRLQEACNKGEILTDQRIACPEASSELIRLGIKNVVVKKNIIEAVKVGVKRAA